MICLGWARVYDAVVAVRCADPLSVTPLPEPT